MIIFGGEMRKVSLLLCLALLIGVVLSGCFGSEIEKIDFGSDKLTLTVGGSSTINVLIIPDNAENKSLIWSSSDETVASVSNGEVKALKKGETTITALSQNGIKASCLVTVNDIEAESVVLSNNSLGMNVGSQNNLTAKVLPADASQDVTWSSSDSSIACVDNNGNVTALKSGNVNIQCITDNGKTASCLVKVKEKTQVTKTQPATTVIVANPNRYYYTSDYILPQSNLVRLSYYDIYGMDDDTLQMAINEIYARHGRPFVTESISNYFLSKPWYYVNDDYSDSSLSEIENYNINFLKNAKG